MNTGDNLYDLVLNLVVHSPHNLEIYIDQNKIKIDNLQKETCVTINNLI